jgi:hypothetical protein
MGINKNVYRPFAELSKRNFFREDQKPKSRFFILRPPKDL